VFSDVVRGDLRSELPYVINIIYINIYIYI
jgi:hypothetical protein